ncbi:MAG: methylmalonyl Co-A mutase-associated GTPase MeaB [Acidilobus sp.]
MTTLSADATELFRQALSGNLRATGRLLSLLENPYRVPSELFDELASRGGRAHVLGITGIPGAGKSTLISRLIKAYRSQGLKVAVVAIDPSSPLSGGALLGDRLRMQEDARDSGVFIRSVSTRGLKGGLSLAALAMVEAFDALGYDKIILETVGVGQAEVDVMNAAHTVVVVTMPGVGDEIQALKAGVMEIGDIYVLNKSDLPDAQKAFEYLSFALDKGELGAQDTGWRPRLVKTSAIMGSGIEELVKAIGEHYDYLVKSGKTSGKLVSRRVTLVRLMAERLLADKVESAVAKMEGKIAETVSRSKGILDIAKELAREACEGL